MNGWLEHTKWLGNTYLSWAIAFGGALLAFILLYAAIAALGAHLRGRAERTGRRGHAVAAATVQATRGWLLFLIAIAVALDVLHFKPPAGFWLHLATYALIGIQISLWLSALVVAWLHQLATHDEADDHIPSPVMMGILTWAVQFVIWVTLLLSVLSFGGVPITSFVASLGIGGVAVALAAQNVLGDLFASISIGIDKPFEVGDSIEFAGNLGTVTKVGVKSTRIQSLSGEELSISNAELLKNLIHNYSRRSERRVVFTFRLPFDTPRDRLTAATERVRGIIEAESPTRFDRGYLSAFGEFGFDFEFVYYVLDPDFNVFVGIQHRINLAMLDAWHELGIEFAVPARTVRAAPAADGGIVQVTGAE